MVTQVKAYISADGCLYATAEEAATRDLSLLVEDAPHEEGLGFLSNPIAAFLVTRRDEVVRILKSVDNVKTEDAD